MIKPDFFASETLGACSVAARVLFISLWVHGNDFGNMKIGLSRLRTDTFRYDQMTDKELLGLLVELEEVECIRGYSVGGDPYVNIPNFETYQTVRKPNKSNVPDVPEECPKHTDFFAVWNECGLQETLARHQYSTSDAPHEQMTENEPSTAPVPHQYRTSNAKRKKERKKEVKECSIEHSFTEKKVTRGAAVDESTPRVTKMFCRKCGQPMRPTSMYKSGTRRRYWRCEACNEETCE